MRSSKKNLVTYIRLCKVRIAFFSAFSAATGFMLSARQPEPKMIVVMMGIFFLASGASALNQYQEKDIDILMPRTMNRPIPSGRLRPGDALYFSVISISCGLLALFLVGDPLLPLLGLCAVIWYNGVYTFLKRRTAFAVIPGALVGALPVAVGWVAGAGGLYDPKLWMVCFFFFMWQVPHSWLFILNYGAEYEKAGLPSLTVLFSTVQLLRINFIWISAVGVSCLLVTMSGAIGNSIVNFSLLVLSAWLVGNGVKLLETEGRQAGYSFAFKRINTYMFFVMSLLVADKLFG